MPLAADGVSHTRIAERLDVSRQTVIPWRQRYEAAALLVCKTSRAQAGRGPSTTTGSSRPPRRRRRSVTYWSSRLLAAKVKIDHATVARA